MVSTGIGRWESSSFQNQLRSRTTGMNFNISDIHLHCVSVPMMSIMGVLPRSSKCKNKLPDEAVVCLSLLSKINLYYPCFLASRKKEKYA
jgi:hypothetical protein